MPPKQNRPSAREAIDAILSCAPARVRDALDRGYDPTRPLRGCDMLTFDHVEEQYTCNPSPDDVIGLSSSGKRVSMAFPLHVAVAGVHDAAVRPGNKDGVDRALRIVEMLLGGGARWYGGCVDVLLFNLEQNRCRHRCNHFEAGTPVQLAAYLKKFELNKSGRAMDRAIDILREASKREEWPSLVDASPVLESVTDNYRTMLFSTDFSDITFRCSDGVSVPAHKVVLAASSPYFKTAFQGNWSEISEGVWTSSYCSKLMKFLLTYIYTGSVIECKRLLKDPDLDSISLLEMACEYDMQPLVLIAVDSCEEKIEVSNVGKTMRLANMHSFEKLKTACFGFIDENPKRVLMRPEIIRLATEDRELWAELGEFLNGEDWCL